MSDVKTRVVRPKGKATDKTRKQPAKSTADWQRQEDAEAMDAPPRVPGQDPVNEAVGRGIFMAQASIDGWRNPKTGYPFFVSRFYFHTPALVIDYPQTQEEADDKAECLAKTDTTYVAVAPGESLSIEQLRERVRKALADKAKALKAPTSTQEPAAKPKPVPKAPPAKAAPAKKSRRR